MISPDALSPHEQLAAETFAAGWLAGVLAMTGHADEIQPDDDAPNTMVMRFPALSPRRRWVLTVHVAAE